MTPEGKVKARITALLKSYKPVWYFMPVAGEFGQCGVPDYIICANGAFVAVEAKAINGRLTPLQTLQLTGVQAANGLQLVVRDDASLDVLERHLLMMGCYPIEHDLKKNEATT